VSGFAFGRKAGRMLFCSCPSVRLERRQSPEAALLIQASSMDMVYKRHCKVNLVSYTFKFLRSSQLKQGHLSPNKTWYTL